MWRYITIILLISGLTAFTVLMINSSYKTFIKDSTDHSAKIIQIQNKTNNPKNIGNVKNQNIKTNMSTTEQKKTTSTIQEQKTITLTTTSEQITTIPEQKINAYCGNGKIDIGETSQNCCIDVNCPESYECKNNSCVKKDCISLNEVKNSADRCLIVFNNNVYDLTDAKKWSLSGHEGKHYCGEIYDAKTINEGAHNKDAERLLKKYFLKELC
ncbi:MAG: hypothetical protein QXY62_04255 [Candidatus Altiarchaeota archaeon]